MRASFVAHVKELLRGLGRLEAKPMFGGHGLYCDGAFFAIVLDDVLYLKADAQSRPRFVAAGLEPFVFAGGGALRFYPGKTFIDGFQNAFPAYTQTSNPESSESSRFHRFDIFRRSGRLSLSPRILNRECSKSLPAQ